MQKLRTLDLGPYQFFVTTFVEPDPAEAGSFTLPEDADEWRISIHFQPDVPYESHVEVARIDTAHGEPHFDRLFEPGQPKEWLGADYSYEDARQKLFANWKQYADGYLDTHY